MAQIKVLYINASGLPQEHSEAGDTIKFSSFLTANWELTDAKLGNLVGGSDIGSTEHNHDGIYFRETEHVNTTAGVADAGKPVVLNASGVLDGSFFDPGAIDHGALGGLGDDDHTQYIRVDGTRAFTGAQSMGSNKLTDLADPTLAQDAATKNYVDALSIGDEWHPDSALDYIVDNTLAPPTEVLNDVYVLSHDGGVPNAAWDGASAGDIVKFNGTLWIATTPTTGKKLSVDDETTSVRLWNGIQWQQQFYESTTASTGLTKVGVDIRLDSSSAGAGLGFSAGVLSTNVDDSSIEVNVDTLRVKADGINDTHIDFGTGANQVSAVDIPVADSGGNFTATEIEGVLAELATQGGISYTVGAGGVSAGDAVYISANNTVLPYSTITASERVIGLALTTEAAAGSVKVLMNDTVITGVLTTAVAGDTYYWNGTALSTTIPVGAGSLVYKAGVAKNASDLHVEVELIKKNA